MTKTIYLAGKVRRAEWRTAIVPQLRGLEEQFGVIGGDVTSLPAWPVMSGAIELAGEQYDYAGPYFISCDHGCYHQADHAWGTGICGFVDNQPKAVVSCCKNAINQADIVFAWIDSADCYGTVVEIGYAAALGKTIYIAGPSRNADMWFTYEMANKTLFGPELTPKKSLEYFLGSWEGHPATEKQIYYLSFLGYKGPAPKTKSEAGKLIAQYKTPASKRTIAPGHERR